MNIFKHSKKLNQSGFDHILVVVSCMVVIAVVGTYVLISNSHAAATSQAELKSGISGTYCLDDNADGGTNAIVDTWGCNGTPAQKFSYSGNLLHIGTNGCAREAGSSATTGQGKGAKWAGSVVIGSCSGPPYGAVWERVGSTFENAHAGSKGGTYCLDVSAFKAKTQLDIYQCNGGANQSWTNYTWTSGGGSGGGGGGGTTSSVVNGVSANCLAQSTTNAKLLCTAEEFGGIEYNYGGAHYWPSFLSGCLGGGSKVPSRIFDCEPDCSGLVSMVVDMVEHTNYAWQANPVGSGYGVTGTGASNWKAVSLNSVQPGDIVAGPSRGSTGHVEFVLKGTGSNITSYGALESNTEVAAHSPGTADTWTNAWQWE